MIVADVNVLVYAFHADEPSHMRYRSWLESTLDGGDAFGLVDVSLIGFMRVVTNPRIYADPAPTPAAAAFVAALVGADGARWVAPNRATWDVFHALVAEDRQVRGVLIPDAWLAAIAISQGCRLATADRGFARFDELDWFDPGRE